MNQCASATHLDECVPEITAKGGLEAVVAAMKRFPKHAMVQAAGCWLVGIISAKDGADTLERGRVEHAVDVRVSHAGEAHQTC